jgi:hypothetical protein
LSKKQNSVRGTVMFLHTMNIGACQKFPIIHGEVTPVHVCILQIEELDVTNETDRKSIPEILFELWTKKFTECFCAFDI